MTTLDILSVGVVLGALISFGIISFALTADILREYLLIETMRAYTARDDRSETSTQSGDRSPQITKVTGTQVRLRPPPPLLHIGAPCRYWCIFRPIVITDSDLS